MDIPLELLNGLAGVAALVNSLLMWPTIKSLKQLGPRVETLEKHVNEIKKASRKTRPRGRGGSI